jgi:hypothetical protein
LHDRLRSVHDRLLSVYGSDLRSVFASSAACRSCAPHTRFIQKQKRLSDRDTSWIARQTSFSERQTPFCVRHTVWVGVEESLAPSASCRSCAPHPPFSKNSTRWSERHTRWIARQTHFSVRHIVWVGVEQRLALSASCRSLVGGWGLRLGGETLDPNHKPLTHQPIDPSTHQPINPKP